MINVSGTKCDVCIHQSVCCHKNDFNDICKAVADASVHKIEPDGKTACMRKVINYDILSDIIVNCRHYRKETLNPRYQDSITTITNPCDSSTSTTSVRSDRSAQTTTDYIFG